MYAIRSYYDRKPARVRGGVDEVGESVTTPIASPHAARSEIRAGRPTRARITSYNVCYTKLLRIHQYDVVTVFYIQVQRLDTVIGDIIGHMILIQNDTQKHLIGFIVLDDEQMSVKA